MYNLGADTGTLFLVINLNNRKNADGKWQSPVGGKAGKARVFEVSQGYNILGN